MKLLRCTTVLAGLVLASLGGWTKPARAQMAASVAPLSRPDFWDVDGKINAIVATNNRVYIGGRFSQVGPKGRKALALNDYTGAADAEFPSLYGTSVNAIASDGQGGWFIGGDFTEAGDLPRTNLVHILSNGQVDPEFLPQPDLPVWTLALAGDTLYVGGDFTSFGGVARSRLAAISLTNQTVTPWNPGANDRVYALAVSDDVIYAGGEFTRLLESENRNHLAALDGVTGSPLSGWQPSFDGHVLALDLVDRRLVVGGYFNTVTDAVDGYRRNGLAMLDRLTGLVLDWDPRALDPTDRQVTAVRVDCETVYVGGTFTNLAGATRALAGAVRLETGQALDWSPPLEIPDGAPRSSVVRSLIVSGDAVYLGGDFAVSDEPDRRDLIAVDAGTGQVLPWQPRITGGVSVLAVAGETVLAGIAAFPGGVERRNLAAFDAITGQATDWNPETDGEVYALAYAGGTLFAGGVFHQVNGQARGHLAAIDGDSGQLLIDWNPLGANTNVWALAALDQSLFVGGSFTMLGGASRRRLAKLDLITGNVEPGWSIPAGGPVYALATAPGRLWVGGNFSSVGVSNRANLALLHAETSQVLPWNPGADREVRALAVAGDRVYAGGLFSNANGQLRNHLAAFDANSGEARADWNPGADSEVRTLVLHGDGLYAGGLFQHVDGQRRYGLARINADGGVDAWNPSRSLANRVYALAASEQLLVAGGSGPLEFSETPAAQILGVFPLQGAPAVERTLTDVRVPLGAEALLTAQATGELPLVYQWFYEDWQLPDATNQTLTVSATNAAVSGRYRMVVANARGAATAEFHLTVLEAVIITDQPAGQTVAPGETVTLSVGVAGHPAPRYQWRLNGRNIPGAVFPQLILPDAQPWDGGSYQVVVYNGQSAARSDVARVIVASASLPMTDEFARRGVLPGSQGVGSGDSTMANREPGEPLHDNKNGGASLWLRWKAPDTGIATFDTRGSTFDTLLAIYAGTNLNELVPVASDDDSGGFYTSRVVFNAESGVEYAIAVDALRGSGGPLVLDWDFQAGTDEVPRITAQPMSLATSLGGTAQLEVTVLNSAGVTYQWYFGCRPLAGETNPVLTFSKVHVSDLGSYYVIVTSESGQASRSLEARLEIGSFSNVVSYDKLVEPEGVLVAAGSNAALTQGLSSSGYLPVALGSIDSQTFPSAGGGGELDEPEHCGIVGGSSRILPLVVEQDGMMIIDTIGSTFDTILAVYLPNVRLADMVRVACDNDGAPDGKRSRVMFEAAAGTKFWVVVDGVNGSQGELKLNWRYGWPPVALPDDGKVTRLAKPSSSMTLSAEEPNAYPSPTFQWYLNGVALSGETSGTLVLDDLTAQDDGDYSVVVSNIMMSVTNLIADVEVAEVPFHFRNYRWDEDGLFRFEVHGNWGESFRLEVADEARFAPWIPMATQRITDVIATFSETNASARGRRFYRVLSPEAADGLE